MRPGELAFEFARRNGWTLRRANLMVEGDSDVRYFGLAAKLYSKSKGLNLVGSDLGVFSPGSGDEGGTFGMFEKFPPLLNIVTADLDPRNGKKLYRVGALMDNDEPGRKLHRALLKQYRYLKSGRDVFLLQRVFPRANTDPKTLIKQIAKHNEGWEGLDTEIEDLIGEDFIVNFIKYEQREADVDIVEINGRRHYKWKRDSKSRLCRYTEQYAALEDVLSLVETLKSLRFYFGLPVDGV